MEYLVVAWVICGLLNYGWAMAYYRKTGKDFVNSFFPAVTLFISGVVGTALFFVCEYCDRKNHVYNNYGWRLW